MITAGSMLDGRYEIIGPIGSPSGMGEVFEAEDHTLGVTVVIKTIKEGFRDDNVLRERFRREAKAAKILQPHPQIINMEYHERRGSQPEYLVMPRYEGTLEGKLPSPGNPDVTRLLPDRSRQYLGEIADTLDYVHKRDILHRDVTPSNIFLDEKGNLVLADFGIAKLPGEPSVTEPFTGPQTAVGYRAPELVAGSEIDHRADLYSLAVILHRMLTGEFPTRQVRGTPPRVRRTIKEVLEKALSDDPADRYKNAAALVADYDRVSANVRNRKGKWGWWMNFAGKAATFLILSLLTGLGLGLMLRPREQPAWNGWYPPNWQVENGRLISTDEATGDYGNWKNQWIAAPSAFQPGGNQYVVDVWMRVVEQPGCGSFGVVLRGSYQAGFHKCDSIGPPSAAVNGRDSGVKFTGPATYPPDLEWHHYRFEMRGDRLRVYRDDVEVGEAVDRQFLSAPDPARQVGLWSDRTKVEFRNFTVRPMSR